MTSSIGSSLRPVKGSLVNNTRGREMDNSKPSRSDDVARRCFFDRPPFEPAKRLQLGQSCLLDDAAVAR